MSISSFPLNRRWAGALALASACLAVSAPAEAGVNCEPFRLTARQMGDALELAARTASWLEASGAKVAVITRAGQNLDQYGLRYSHLGFVYRDDAAKAWRVVHKLNECGSDRADLYRQGLAEFYLDDLYRYEGAVMVLKPEVQKNLLPILKESTMAAALHEPRYNMVAYPWSVKFQQSNQWALETLALAVEPSVSSRARAQAWLQFKGYQPSVLKISPVTRMGARVARNNVSFSDHPDENLYANRVETVTVDSVFRFLRTSGLSEGDEVVMR